MSEYSRRARTAVEKAYEAVLEKILSGEYPPRSHLIESEVAANASVSRTPVREALKRLSAEGYVMFHPNRGAFVADRKLDDEAYDAIGLRGVIEAYGAELAASRITEGELEQLVMLDKRISEALSDGLRSRQENAVSLSLDFHRLLARASRSETLVIVVRLLIDRPFTPGLMARFDDSAWDVAQRTRCGIIEALRSGDGKRAAALLSSLVLQTRQYVYLSNADIETKIDAISGDTPQVFD